MPIQPSRPVSCIICFLGKHRKQFTIATVFLSVHVLYFLFLFINPLRAVSIFYFLTDSMVLDKGTTQTVQSAKLPHHGAS
jgi:hypothetical protein